MKRLVIFFFTLAVGIVLISRLDKSLFLNLERFLYRSSCDNPIHYKIGIIDQRFNLSQNQFLSYTGDAALVWNNASAKKLFVYDPNGLLEINLVFDQRQSLNNQIRNLENDLKSNQGSIEEKRAEYDKLSLDFRQRLDNLNKQISFWNEKGGAPAEEYAKLKKEQEDLKEEANSLNALAKTLNRSFDLFNTEVGKLNQTVESFNAALKFKPEEGIYDPKVERIDIYFNNNQNETIHTLAHEMGHALGLAHIQNEKAIMYAFTTQQINVSDDDILALQKVCQEHSLFEILENKIFLLFIQLSSNNKNKNHNQI